MDRGQVEGRLYGRNGKLQKQQAAGVSEGQQGGQFGWGQRMYHWVRPEWGGPYPEGSGGGLKERSEEGQRQDES